MSIPVTREYRTEAGFTSRLAVAQLRSSFAGWSMIPPAIAAVFFVGLAVFGVLQQQPSFLFFPAILIVAVAAAILVTKVQADRVTPTGSLYSATLGEKALTVGIGSTVTEVPYRNYSHVRRSGRFVALRFRSARVSLLLPEELFPGDDFDALAAAVADPVATTAADALDGGLGAQLDHTYTTDAGYASRFARSVLIRAFVRGPMIVILVLITGLGLLMLLGGLLGLLLAGSGTVPVSEVGPMFGAAAFFLGFTALIIFGSFLLIRGQLRRLIPAGSIYGIGFGESTLTMRGPVNSAELPYSSYKRVRRRGDFIDLIGKRGIARVILPAELFPGTELERLNALLQANP